VEGTLEVEVDAKTPLIGQNSSTLKP